MSHKATIEGAGLVALGLIGYRIIRGVFARLATSMGFPFVA